MGCGRVVVVWPRLPSANNGLSPVQKCGHSLTETNQLVGAGETGLNTLPQATVITESEVHKRAGPLAWDKKKNFPPKVTTYVAAGDGTGRAVGGGIWDKKNVPPRFTTLPQATVNKVRPRYTPITAACDGRGTIVPLGMALVDASSSDKVEARAEWQLAL